MFVTVHTCEGWVVRDETGRDVTDPTPSLRNAECERAELEADTQACKCVPIYADNQLLDVALCDACQAEADAWAAPLVEMGGYRHDG